MILVKPKFNLTLVRDLQLYVDVSKQHSQKN